MNYLRWGYQIYKRESTVKNMEINESVPGNGSCKQWFSYLWIRSWVLRSEQEIRNKVEELRKIRFQHSKNCQIPLDKCDVAKEYDLLIDVLEWVLES